MGDKGGAGGNGWLPGTYGLPFIAEPRELRALRRGLAERRLVAGLCRGLPNELSTAAPQVIAPLAAIIRISRNAHMLLSLIHI